MRTKRFIVTFVVLAGLSALVLYGLFSPDQYFDGYSAGYMREKPSLRLLVPVYRTGYEMGKKDRQDPAPFIAATKKYGLDRRALARELKLNATQFDAYVRSLGIRDLPSWR
jgi:hypothetical protein